MLEFEKKIMLTEEEYVFLKTYRYHGKTAVHNNYYYDTDTFELNRSGITCRIREEDDSCTMTIKVHQEDECSTENSKAIKDLHDDLYFLSMGIKCQGKLTTIRTTVDLCPGVKIMLDQNIYLNTSDCEIEIEYEPGYEERAYKEIDMMTEHMRYFRATVANADDLKKRVGQGGSKASRFFKRKAEMNKHERGQV